MEIPRNIFKEAKQRQKEYNQELCREYFEELNIVDIPYEVVASTQLTTPVSCEILTTPTNKIKIVLCHNK